MNVMAEQQLHQMVSKLATLVRAKGKLPRIEKSAHSFNRWLLTVQIVAVQVEKSLTLVRLVKAKGVREKSRPSSSLFLPVFPTAHVYEWLSVESQYVAVEGVQVTCISKLIF
jgi:hypothetical protein